MSRTRRTPLVLALVLLVALFVLPATAPAHAVASSRDRTPLTPMTFPTTGGNMLLDADVFVGVEDNPITFVNIAAEGYLHLTPQSNGSYTGTFRDNVNGGKTYPAHATHVSPTTADGTYVINTGNGPFTITIASGTQTTVSVPKKYGAGARAFLFQSAAHLDTTQPAIPVTIGTVTIGQYLPTTTGTLTLVTDAANCIVPFSKALNTPSRFTYSVGSTTRSGPITEWGQYQPADGTGSGYLTATLKIGKAVLHIADAKETDNSGAHTARLTGTVYGINGGHFFEAQFTTADIATP